MNIRKHLKILHPFVGLKQMIQCTSQKIIIPFYHTVSNEKLPHIDHLYTKRNVKQFEEDLEYLCKHYSPIDIEELYKIKEEDTTVVKPVFHITFDDGLSEIHSIIAAVLERKGIPASFFLNTDFLDNKGLFYRYKISLIIDHLVAKPDFTPKLVEILRPGLHSKFDLKKTLLNLKYEDTPIIDQVAQLLEIDFNEYLKNTKPYLSSVQVRDLLKRGFNIGSHSSSHPFLKHLDEKMRKDQISESFTFLKNNFGVTQKYFSFPFSDDGIDKAFFRWMYTEEKCLLSFGISGLKNDFPRYHVHRIPFEISNQKASDIIKSEYLYYLIKMLFGKNTILRT